MSKFPKFYFAKSPMADPGGEYIYHSQLPRFLAKRVTDNPLSDFEIVDDIDNMGAYFKGDVSKVAGLMRRLGDWYVSYLNWENDKDI